MLAVITGGQLGFAAESAAGLPSMAIVTIVAATLVLALAVTVRAVVVPAESPVGTPAAVRRRNDLTVFLPLRDPNHSGRPRPRAPSN